MKGRKLLGLALVGMVALATSYAVAQRVDARRPTTFVVGATPGPAPTVRVDAARTGLSRAAFPKAPLKIDWRKPIGSPIDQSPLALADAVVVVSGRGEVLWYGSDGGELAKQYLGGVNGAPIALPDGTIVVGANGDLVGVRREGVRFRLNLGTDRSRMSLLALLDGGFAVAYGAELVVVDGEGNVRARTTAPEAPDGPLVSADGKIFFATPAGTVWSWNAGRDVTRVGSFGGPIDGGMALEGGRTAFAVVDQARLVALDLGKGVALPRATSGAGLFLGPVALRSGSTTLMALVPGRTFALTIDANGQETLRAPLTPPSLSFLSFGDGGVAAFTVPSHTGLLVDDAGAIAFASPEGTIGVIDAGGVPQSLGEAPCAKASGRGITALVPGGPGVLYVACGAGTLLRITGS
jgi:hypothetical protein